MIELYSKVGVPLKRENPFFQFPGGEHHMKYKSEYIGHEIAYIEGTDVNDYIKGLLWSDCLHASEETTVIIPYLPAARADKGTPRGAVVYSSLLPDVENYIFVDVHSEYMLHLVASKFSSQPVNITAKDIFENCKKSDNNWKGVIAPDKGAEQRAYEVASYLDVPLYQAEKVRDYDTGKLSGFKCEEIPFGEKLLIVDDICDGGGTFNGLAEYLWDEGKTKKGDLDLYVTHGIFSQGFQKLEKWFGTIYTTDSIFDRDKHAQKWMEPENLHVIKIKDYLLSLV